jgi:hypothetical protein
MRCVCTVGFVLFQNVYVEAEPSYVTVDARLRYNSSSFSVAEASAKLVASVSTKFDIEPSMLVDDLDDPAGVLAPGVSVGGEHLLVEVELGRAGRVGERVGHGRGLR